MNKFSLTISFCSSMVNGIAHIYKDIFILYVMDMVHDV